MIVDFSAVKPARAPRCRAKIKNIMTGSVLEKNIQSYGKIENAHVEKKEMQYLYNDGSLYYIMDSETFRADSR